ncbi:MAG TPA: ATP synthase F0 subunit B [Thermoanaerobaculia bacterium]|nr:ATP synthase F0 subunit B [Thermoanaerobaculia bacterium]
MTRAAALLFLEQGHEAARGFLGVPSLVWQVLNLGLFLGLLWYFLRKPLAGFFENRKSGVAAALAKADEDRRRAEQLSAELKARLTSIEGELENLKSAARREADAEHAALLARSQADADHILARTRADLDNRVRAARAELTAYAGDLSVDLAREILRKTVTQDDEKRLLSEGIARLSGAAKS